MTSKELRHLNRAQLLELLLDQAEENRRLKKRLKAMEIALSDRRIAVHEAGTLADAALKLNGVFEAADEAARQYLENVRRMEQKGRDFL